MFGAIDAGLLLDLVRTDGYMYQLDLPLDCPPMLFIDEEYLSSVPVKLDYIDAGGHKAGMLSVKDHPTFDANRTWLDSRGYIRKQTMWWNGDRVLKPFYLNGMLFDIGDKFPCGGAMKIHLKFK